METGRQASRQAGKQARRAHTPYPFIPFIMIENKSPVLLLSKATKYHHAHTHDARGVGERERKRGWARGREKEAKENCSNQDSRVVPHRSTN